MSEIPPSPEGEVTRDQVLSAYRRIRERGFRSPDHVPLDDPEAEAAQRLRDAWSSGEEARATATGSREARLQHNLDQTMLMIEAGFDDPRYLAEVASEFLVQDLKEAVHPKYGTPVPGIAEEIRKRIKDIKERLEEKNE
ncbi:MAG: hypothetical protein AAB495_01555 [Patescibacteria group bacterium]